MDYQKFFNEVVGWINQSNQMAMKYGLDSDDFWNWVITSTGEISTRYNNNPLVIKQMAMLYEWLDDIYAKGVSR
jgi:hypothetical protein